MEQLDPKVKLQFWTRQSQYQRLKKLCPNKGDQSEIMRQGLDLAIQIANKRLAVINESFTPENQEAKAS